jgi:hypothetical protein
MKNENIKKAILLAVLMLLMITVAVIVMAQDEKNDVQAESIQPESIDITYSVIRDMEPVWKPDEADVEALAKLIYREARGCSTMEQAAVIWCVLNRVDSAERYFPDTILEVIKQPNQFAYIEDTPLWPAHVSLAEDVLTRWHEEKEGAEDVGRVLPAGYVYFCGDGKHNHFSKAFRSKEYWSWELPNPYEN